MATNPTIHSTIYFKSNQLCFGSLHNIWQGTTIPAQSLPAPQPQPNGTVMSHAIDYNVPAQIGTWNAFQLVSSESNDTVAWFVAHADVDPREEIDKILRVSGSPYDPDHGSTVNNESTSREGVLVINRYDWSYYDNRFFQEIGEGLEEGDNDLLANSNSLGLVDCSTAQEMVHQWKRQRPSERVTSDHGIWLYIPHGEYMFGRFGFDDSHNAARSFLFFSAFTEFTRTSFKDDEDTLRKFVTPQGRFEIELSEGFDFSGIDIILDIISNQSVVPPSESEKLGPYDLKHFILREQDIEALRLYRNEPEGDHIDDTATGLSRSINEFVDSWKQPLFDLLNEMALSYVEHFVLPYLGGDDITVMAKSLFPNHDKDNKPISLDVGSYHHFIEPGKRLIPNFDMAGVSTRVRVILESLCVGKSKAFKDNAINGISRVLAYIFAEVLELADNAARDEQRNKILPCDVRLAVLQDEEILTILSFSRVFWEGKP